MEHIVCQERKRALTLLLGEHPPSDIDRREIQDRGSGDCKSQGHHKGSLAPEHEIKKKQKDGGNKESRKHHGHNGCHHHLARIEHAAIGRKNRGHGQACIDGGDYGEKRGPCRTDDDVSEISGVVHNFLFNIPAKLEEAATLVGSES